MMMKPLQPLWRLSKLSHSVLTALGALRDADPQNKGAHNDVILGLPRCHSAPRLRLCTREQPAQ
jgi:hypothetical protein